MASVPFEFVCNMASGFVTDPNQHQRIGYVTSLGGLGMAAPLSTDLQVPVPWNVGTKPAFTGLQSGGSASTAVVVGVIGKFSWAGGVGDPIKLDFYVSQRNAMQLKSLQQAVLKTAAINPLAWWIVDYDQQVKMWFEEAFPLAGSVTGVLQGQTNPSLSVSMSPVAMKSGINANVYKVSLAVVPAGNKTYMLRFASSSNNKVVKSWGLVVGTT